MMNYKIKCPCHRGYMKELWINNEGVPVAFSLNKGYIVISGYCDYEKCGQQFMWTCSLADLLTEEAPNWTSAVTKKL